MLQRFQLAFLIVGLAVASGCRTPMSPVSRHDSIADRPFQPVAQSSEPVEVVPAIEQASADGDDSESTATRIWTPFSPGLVARTACALVTAAAASLART